MDKYAQLKRFYRDHRLQVYMYNFVYVDPQKMPVGDHLAATKIFFVNYNKMATPLIFPKHCLVFSYIRS